MGGTWRMLWQWLTKVPNSDSQDSPIALGAMRQIFMKTPDLAALTLHSRPAHFGWQNASCVPALSSVQQSGTVLPLTPETLRDFTNPPRSRLISPGIKLESKAQARLSVVLPVHWLPTGNKMMHWRARNWKPDESHSDHSDHSDQLSATSREGHTCRHCKQMLQVHRGRNNLYFSIMTEGLIPSYHHLAGERSFLTVKQRQFGFGKSLWNLESDGKFVTDVLWIWLLPWPLCVEVRSGRDSAVVTERVIAVELIPV